MTVRQQLVLYYIATILLSRISDTFLYNIFEQIDYNDEFDFMLYPDIKNWKLIFITVPSDIVKFGKELL